MQVGISIIIPVYNVEKYLRACLDSVLEQTFSNYEAICVDDGSLDYSGMILDEYAEKSDRIHVLHQKNQGVSAARNTGIARAVGKYICFLDGDDLLVPNALEKMWQAAESDAVDILTYEVHSLRYENEILKKNKNLGAYFHIANEYCGVQCGRDFFVEMIKNDDFVETVWVMLIRLEWLREHRISFCPDAIFEDAIYVLECYFQCERMKHSKEKLYIYRIRNDSTMTQKYTYKYLYYRIWYNSECFRMLYTYAENERERSAIALFVEKSINMLKYIYGNLDKQEKEKLCELNGVYGLFAKMIGIGKASTDSCNELKLIGLLEEMKRYPKILLYGAGMIGNKVKAFIHKHELQEKIMGFAVSREQDEIDADGLHIKSISKYEVSDEILLIIAARESYHREMLEQAKACGYSKIRLIDCDIECLIDEALESCQRVKGQDGVTDKQRKG